MRPSPIFLGVVAATAAGAWLCVARPIDDGVAVFLFVVAGWVLSLILHEFAHAFVALRGGDLSVVDKGYLTLDPRRYTDPLTSIALPLFFLVAGGFGLPGGAVWINRGALRSTAVETAVSLAGPATNLVVAAVCLVPLSTGIVDTAADPVLARALGFLGFVQIFAFVLNMLPVPGLDGFGAIEPHLPASTRALLRPLRQWSFIILFVLLFGYQPAADLLWRVVTGIMDWFGTDPDLAFDGYRLLTFWD